MQQNRFTEDDRSPVKYLVLPLWILAISAIGSLMYEAATIFLWIVCSFFLFVILDPLAQRLKRRRIPTGLTAMILVLAATAIAVATCYFLGHLFSTMLSELEQSRKLFLQTFHSLVSSWNEWTAKLPGLPSSPAHDDVSKVQVVQGSPLGGEMGGTILHGVGSAVTVVTFAILVPILAFFLLAERDSLACVLRRAYADPMTATGAWATIVKSTRAFFVGNLVLGILTYPVFVLLFWAFSVPSIFTVAALATFFNLVPFAGAVLSGFLPALTLYAQSQSIPAPIGVYGLCVAIHFLVADFVTPKILGSQVNINATTSTIALVAWGELWGGLGLILAIPLTSLIKTLFEHSNFPWLEWLAHLMSEDVDEALNKPAADVNQNRLRPKS